MSLSKKTIDLLRELIDAGEISSAPFNDKQLLGVLKENGMVTMVLSGKTRKKIKLLDKSNLLQYIRLKHRIDLYERWEVLLNSSSLP